MAALTPAQALVEAQAALHALSTGQLTAEFRDQNGETVRFAATNRAGLMAYIASLQQTIAGLPVCRGPIGFIF